MKKICLLLFVLIVSTACAPVAIEQVASAVPSTATSTITPVPTQTLTPTVTHIPKSTAIPCPAAGAPLVIDGVNIYFSENGLKTSTCDIYAGFIVKANEWAKSTGESLVVNVYIYNSAEDAGQADFDLGLKTKCNNYTSNSLPEIIQSWTRDKAIAYPSYSENGSSYPPSVILNTAWRVPKQQTASTTVHELTHAIQSPYYGNRNPCSNSIPSWWSEGQAMYYGYGVIETWGFPYWEMDLAGCNSIQLDKLPQPTDACVYAMGREALALLTHMYGDISFDVWKEFAKGGSFESAFKTIYGISVHEYSDIFEEYKQCVISLGFDVRADRKCLGNFDAMPTP